MTIEQFTTQLSNHLVSIFPREKFSLKADYFIKNNNTKHYGIVVRHKEEPVAPTIYIEQFYEDYLRKKYTMDEIVDQIQQLIHEITGNLERFHNFSIQWDDCKDKITYRLISKEMNGHLLSRAPHLPFLNLAIVFYVVLHMSEDGIEAICITEELQNKWNVSIKELFEYAEKNTPKFFQPRIETMQKALREYLQPENMFDEREDSASIYIFSNKTGINGATVLLYTDLIRNFANKMQSNLYILPSSIHEVLVLLDKEENSLEELSDMVKTINHSQLLQEEILSNNAYYYDWIEDKFHW